MAERVLRPGAVWWVPERLEAGMLRAGVEGCKGCELHLGAVHGVPGTGAEDATLMMIGEQPGAREDACGEPFVGPSGRVLGLAMRESGIERDDVFLTNAVKHFRFRTGANGKRLHLRPTQVHVSACGPWLVAEVDMVRPRGVVLLGATAGSAVFGPEFQVDGARGRALDWPGSVQGRSSRWSPEWVVATIHPAAVLRSRDRQEDYRGLVRDLELAARLLGGRP